MQPTTYSTGVLPSHELEHLIRSTKEIEALEPIEDSQIQPASLDLRLGAVAYRVRASFLPGKNATVAQRLSELAMHEMDLSRGGVLERGCVYEGGNLLDFEKFLSTTGDRILYVGDHIYGDILRSKKESV